MADTIFQTLTDPRYYPRPDSPEEPDELSFDYDAHPTEHECNGCRWRGQSPSQTNYPWGSIEKRFCPTCQEWIEAEEWNTVPADPFEHPLLWTAASVADLQSEVVRKPAAQQLNLFREVA